MNTYDGDMKTNVSNLERTVCMCKEQKTFNLKKVLIILLIVVIGMTEIPAKKVLASEEDMPGYTNPHDIIIATPANKYSTKAASISILGACDYEYPLYLNGQLIETTEYGFFTTYVDLKVGINTFTFENNGKVKEHTIVRKASTSGATTNTSSGSKVKYKEYSVDTYGVITSKYAMPRTTPSSSDLDCMPLTRGTTFKILGEYGSYYKIDDGTYVSKSSITKYKKKLEDNHVTAAKIVEISERNQVVTELTMNVNALYEVYFEGYDVYLTLYQTSSAKQPSVPKNSIIKSISTMTDNDNNLVTYCFELYDSVNIAGYDVLFNNGVMKFELKKAPELGEDVTLEGTTVFLDAGHGDYDSGTVGPMGKYGPVEKDVNLNITLYTKEYLEKQGAKVVLSRSDDTFYSLSDRVSMIRNLRPDISVSIHGNSLDYISNYSKTSGFLTYYSYSLGNDYAEQMNESIANSLGFTVKPTRDRSLSLTRLTTCPAVLLETAFFSNPYDYEYLIKKENQKAFGEAIGKAIEEYLRGKAEEEVFTYMVKKGDTLASIAKKYNTTISEILKYNEIEDINQIYIGQEIIIPE